MAQTNQAPVITVKMSSVLPESILSKVSPEDRKAMGKAGLTKADCEQKAHARNERDLQRLIVNYLQLKGIEALWHRTDKRSTATVGWPDLTFAAKGFPVAWEIKFEKGKLSEEQELMAVKLKRNGWRFAVIRSLEEAKKELWKILGI